jgi:hypothetical protein
MINAIFIQSFYDEIRDGRLQKLINNIFLNLNKKNIKVIIFLDSLSSTLEELINFPDESNISIIYIVEDGIINPTSKIFQFMMNYEVEKYKRILLLESDCVIKKDFDVLINEDLENLKNPEWYIYGSQYYGLEPWMNIDSEQGKFRKKHMNGVAVYNRSKSFINLINNLFVSENLINNEVNYDFAIHFLIKDLNIYNKMIDSELILNISRLCDMKLRHENIKSKCAIVHTKNKNYSFDQ